MLSFYKKHKALLIMSIITSILYAAVAVGAAFVLENILNAVTLGDWALFRKMIVVAVVYVVSSTIIYILDSLCKKKLVMHTVKSMRQELYEGVLSRNTEHYYATNTADYISALTNDVKTVEDNALVPFLQAVQYILIFFMSAAALMYYSPLITGLMLVCLVAMYLLPASLGKVIGRRQTSLSQSLAKLTIGLKDQFSGYDVIRSFQLVERTEKAFAQQNDDTSEKRYSVDRLLAYSEGLSQMIGLGTQLAVMLFSAWLVLQGYMTAGVLLAMLQLSGSFVQPVAVVMQAISKIQGAKPVTNRLHTLCKKEPSSFTGSKEFTFDHEIQFNQVSFGYAPEQAVLEELTLTLEKNKKYALIGGSGSGKSTLVKLLCANYSSYNGDILIDGNELHKLNIDSLLTQISIIHQNVYMFDESIGDNISLHRNYSKDEWAHALSVSGADNFLDQMADGLQTPVGENGVNLSGGQRQRVAVARALIERKPILILDEGTSAVDARTAYDIETALVATTDITIITITHALNPNLLCQYDGILFMEDGCIAEAGSYNELIALDNKFVKFAQLKKEKAVQYEDSIKSTI